MAEEEKTPDVSEKSGKKRTVIIATVAAVVVFAGVGGYAYASNSAYGSYESRVESAKESDSKLVKKIAEAQSLVKTTKESDVLDKAVLDSLSKSVKTGETRKGIPDIGNVGRWNLWSVSKANASVSNDMTEANDSINAIGKAMGKVEASKTAKQVKDARSTLDKTISDAETLYKDSEGKVQDNKTRESLKTAIDTAKKTVDDKKSDVKTLNAQKDAVSKAVKSVNDSKTAKEQADAEAKAEEAARQAAQQQSQVQTQTYSNTNYSRANSGTSTYSAPTQQAQTQQSAPQQSQNQNNSSSNSGYTKFCATFDTSGAESIFTPCN
jgi:myosin heavy subunit